jgi:tetratricopeptide (TPR) repeat protein
MILLIILSLFRYKADLYFKHARKLIYENELSDAIQSYEMATKYNPLLLYYRNVLNRIYLEMGINDFSKSQGSLTDDQPDTISREQTTVWITNAIAGAEEVQKLDPEDYHSAFTLGQAYHLLDKISDENTTKDAIRYYKKSITLRPFRFKFRDKLALLYVEKGQYKDAIHELKEAQYISPDNEETCLNLAKVYMNDNERYEDAEAVLLEFIKKNPDQEVIDIYRLLSYVYLKTAKWEKLLKQSEKIIRLEQKDLNAHKYAIMASFKLERYNDARNLCKRILDLSGSQNNTYSKYAKEMLELL